MIRKMFLFVLMISLACANCFAVSLWKGESMVSSSLFSDHKARNINDAVMVLIIEQSSASRTAKTTTGRSTTVDGKIESWFSIDGISNIIKGLFGSSKGERDTQVDKANTSNLPEWKLSAAHDFEGSGTTVRSDIFTAKITCKVTDVLENGNLIIEGNQKVTVNEETQILLLKGKVRPRDIKADNTVYSYNIFDAEISYLGDGPIGAKQKRGLFELIGDIVWPF